MARRRKLSGRPLLVATAATAMLVGCGGSGKASPDPPPPPGNLMPPPSRMIELCVDAEPDGAKVEASGARMQTLTERCEQVEVYEGGRVQLTVSAPDHIPQSLDLEVGTKDRIEQKVQLHPSPAIERPVGNLMPPPQIDDIPELDQPPKPEIPEPPVGNLMPPPQIPKAPPPAPK